MEPFITDDFNGSPGSMVGRTLGGWTYVNPPAIGYSPMVLDGGGHAGSSDGSYNSIQLVFSEDLSTFDSVEITYKFNTILDGSNGDQEIDMEFGNPSHGDQQPANLYLWIAGGSATINYYTYTGPHDVIFNVAVGDTVTLRIPTTDQGYTAEVLHNGVSMYLYGTVPFSFPEPFALTIMGNVPGGLDQLIVGGTPGSGPPDPDVVPFHIRDDFNGTRKSILGQLPNIVTGVTGVTPTWGYGTQSVFPTLGTPTDNSNYGWLQSGAGYCWIKSGLF